MMNRKKICRLLITAMMIMTLFGCEQEQIEPDELPEFTQAAEVSLLAAYQEAEETVAAKEVTEEATEPAENNFATSNEDSTTRTGSNRSAGTESSGDNGSSDEGNTNTDNRSESNVSGDLSSDSNGSDSPAVPTEPDHENPAEEKDLTEHTHQYVVSYIQEACCSEQGYTTYACSSCGDSYKDDYTDTLPHNFKVTVVEPTVYSQGYTLYECTTVCSHIYDHSNFSTACLYSYTTDYTDKLPADADTSGCTHFFVETTEIHATCDHDGIQKYTCEFCGLAHTEVIPAYTEHKWVLSPSGGMEPGCDYDGDDGYFCEYCRLRKPDGIIPALGHEYAATIVEPTETTMGYTEFTCSRCGDSFRDNYTDATGTSHTHSYSSVVTEPTCSENGYTTYTCECGHSYKGNEVQAKGDIMESRVVPPTEREPGYTEHWCIVCGMSYRSDYTDLQENGEITQTLPEVEHTHSMKHEKTRPNCTEEGYTTHTCVMCGYSYVDTYVPAAGHTWGEWSTVVAPTASSAGRSEKMCSECYLTESKVLEMLHSHNYSNTLEYVAATCTSDGYTKKACSCGDIITETLTGSHDWVNRHTDEVGHYVPRIVCHCGWSCSAEGDYISAYAAHIDTLPEEEKWTHSYYEGRDWVVDVPARDWSECSFCGAEN